MSDLPASITRCAFTVNPDTDDPNYVRDLVVRKYPFTAPFSGKVILGALKRLPPPLLRMGSFVTVLPFEGMIREIEMIYLGVPMSAREILDNQDEALRRIRGSVRHSISGLRANVVGLGGATAINGLAKTIGSEYGKQIAVTSGNGFTSVMAVSGALGLFRHVGHWLGGASVAVIGAAGLVGRNSAFLLASELDWSNTIYLVGRAGDTSSRLAELKQDLHKHTNAKVIISDLGGAIRQSKLILAVSSSADTLAIDPRWLLPGTVVVDVARPRDIALQLVSARDDIFVVDGGVVSCPFMKQSFTFGFDKGTLFACMAETILIALMGNFQGVYSVGDVNLDWLQHLRLIAQESGMKLAGWRSFDHPFGEDKIRRIMSNAGL
jgi:fatty aldehyde-generating acyl-ACP reductase